MKKPEIQLKILPDEKNCMQIQTKLDVKAPDKSIDSMKKLLNSYLIPKTRTITK